MWNRGKSDSLATRLIVEIIVIPATGTVIVLVPVVTFVAVIVPTIGAGAA